MVPLFLWLNHEYCLPMDILTHVLSGVTVGHLYRPKNAPFHGARITQTPGPTGQNFTETGNAVPFGAITISTQRAVRWSVLIGSVLPDIDIVFLLGGWTTYREYHRGPTHSVWGIILLAFLLNWIIGKRFPQVSKRRIFLWGLGGMVMHLGLDLLTSYRTYLLWPLPYRFSTGILRFHDRTGWYLMGGMWILSTLGNRIQKRIPLPLHAGGLGMILYGGYILLQAAKRYGVWG